ncbi:hypothetical protein ACFZAG_39285, partial [Streptomyces sp. NPDC012403]|uniref:hypothetical protein n=1 Tax=Streptomyces sp. NPDC012403 TaxID=3364831 RepID=UPI0036E8427E
MSEITVSVSEITESESEKSAYLSRPELKSDGSARAVSVTAGGVRGITVPFPDRSPAVPEAAGTGAGVRCPAAARPAGGDGVVDTVAVSGRARRVRASVRVSPGYEARCRSSSRDSSREVSGP